MCGYRVVPPRNVGLRRSRSRSPSALVWPCAPSNHCVVVAPGQSLGEVTEAPLTLFLQQITVARRAPRADRNHLSSRAQNVPRQP